MHIAGHAFAWPAFGGERKRFLGGFLREIEVAKEADQARENAAPLFAEGLFEDSASPP
jgi:hypothetical protein